MTGTKEPVRLRKRAMPSGNTSLYLDIYLDGKRTYEYLKLYLIPEKSRADREKNRQTLQLAEAVRAKRVVEVRNGKFGFDGGGKPEADFLEYYRGLCERRRKTEGSLGNWGNWWSALQHLERYCKPGVKMKDITPEWVRGFKDYLDTAATLAAEGANVRERRRLAQNSKVSYFNKLRACVNAAFEEGIITRNPLRGVEGFKTEEKERVYLALDEVRRMAAEPCEYPVLKRAFLFSCLTGLRKSDIEKMRWSEVREEGEFADLGSVAHYVYHFPQVRHELLALGEFAVQSAAAASVEYEVFKFLVRYRYYHSAVGVSVCKVSEKLSEMIISCPF